MQSCTNQLKTSWNPVKYDWKLYPSHTPDWKAEPKRNGSCFPTPTADHFHPAPFQKNTRERRDRGVSVSCWPRSLAQTCLCGRSNTASEIWTCVWPACSLSRPPPPSQTHRPSRCRPNNPSPWQTKHQAGQSGHIALPLAHCTFFGQLEFHSYLWRRVTVGGL